MAETMIKARPYLFRDSAKFFIRLKCVFTETLLITQRNQVGLGRFRKFQGRLVCIATAFQAPPLLTNVNV